MLDWKPLLVALLCLGCARLACGATPGEPVPTLLPTVEVRSGSDSSADSLYRQARALFDTGRLEDAQTAIETAICTCPPRASFFMLLGRIQLLRGQGAEAQVAFAEAARLDPENIEAAALADRLARKLSARFYAAGMEAVHRQAWTRAREMLEQALARESLGPEHSAIAQQYLVIARFAEARVQQEIAKVQAARKEADRAYFARHVSLREAGSFPVSNGPGTSVTFQGWVLEMTDDPALIVTTRRSNLLSRRIGERGDSFMVLTPRPLPVDPRVGRGSVVEVRGRLVDPSSVGGPGAPSPFDRPRVAVMADAIVFYRQGDSGREQAPHFAATPPGLEGPLKVDFLRYTEEQRQNLPTDPP